MVKIKIVLHCQLINCCLIILDFFAVYHHIENLQGQFNNSLAIKGYVCLHVPIWPKGKHFLSLKKKHLLAMLMNLTEKINITFCMLPNYLVKEL